jgi:hypothetical protein
MKKSGWISYQTGQDPYLLSTWNFVIGLQLLINNIFFPEGMNLNVFILGQTLLKNKAMKNFQEMNH